MNVLLLCGMLFTQGFGTTNTGATCLAGFQAEALRVEVQADTLNKLENGSGWRLAFRPSLQIGSTWFIEPGLPVSYQHTNQWSKTRVYGEMRGGYQWWNARVWAGAGAPINDSQRWHYLMGIDLQTNGPVIRMEFLDGHYPGGSGAQFTVMAGKQW